MKVGNKREGVSYFRLEENQVSPGLGCICFSLRGIGLGLA
jgi:hypothetical protein